jgi:N-acetylmuramoyl-L-alanine amidase
MTSFSIQNNKLVSNDNSIIYKSTTKKSAGTNKTQYIVIHFTAGASFEADLEQLSTSNAQVSCHLLIGRDGKVAQVGNFKDILWHAGVSEWDGINGLNQYSIGIELANPGAMDVVDSNTVKTWWGKTYSIKNDGIILAKHPYTGSSQKGWLPYTDIQLKTLENVVDAIKTEYNIKEVIGHEQIAPKRKNDPGIGAIFSKEELIKLNNKPNNSNITIKVKTNGGNLNIRKGPGTNYSVIKTVPNNTILISSGMENNYYKLIPDGYVSASFVEKQ